MDLSPDSIPGDPASGASASGGVPDPFARGAVSSTARESVLTDFSPPGRVVDQDRVWVHVGLFLATFACTVFVAGWGGFGTEIQGVTLFNSLIAREGYYLVNGWPSRLADALMYAVPFLLFLTVHEFGHYFAAVRSRIRVSLPYYIPLPFALGTFGAVIRIKEPIRRTRQLFDIGASGPLAGFVVALGVLLVAVLTLPPVEYLLSADVVLPGFDQPHVQTVQRFLATGTFPSPGVGGAGGALVFGDTPLFHAMQSLGAYRVPGYEVMHYPLLLAGWLGLFFTALNLLPVGQLDGGHVIYAMFGPAVHAIVARITTLVLLVSGSVGWADQMVPELARGFGDGWLLGGWGVLALILFVYLRRFFGGSLLHAALGVPILLGLTFAVLFFAPGLADAAGYWGWLIWSGLILFVIRLDHPPVLVQEPLTPMRKALGWACIVIFLACFSLQPIGVG
ncbi:MAG: site-2 protease family protein [Bacteroidota bacterium]